MVLSDFLSSKLIDNDYIKDFTLIEPSQTNLIQCVDYVHLFYMEAKINLYNKREANIKEEDIQPLSNTVLHILSNVIDLDEFKGEQIADILSRDKSHNNIVVCVSPYYQEAARGKRMADFGKKLEGYSLEYKFEKHTDEWDKTYSCQIHIYTSSYY